jgi:hypothetical protein
MIRSRLSALASILWCTFVGAHAQTEVAFIGGNITYMWQSSGIFRGRSGYDWVGYGSKVGDVPGPCHETNHVLAVLENVMASFARGIRPE